MLNFQLCHINYNVYVIPFFFPLMYHNYKVANKMSTKNVKKKVIINVLWNIFKIVMASVLKLELSLVRFYNYFAL